MIVDRRTAPAVIVGACCIVAGGLVSAAVGPLDFADGSWLAAFLVLVAGVAQIVLAIVQDMLAARAPSVRVLVTELAAWNLGCALVIVGTLVAVPAVVDAGGVLLVVALVLSLYTTWRSTGRLRWLLWLYRAFVVVLLVSIPIGLLLAAAGSARSIAAAFGNG